MKKNYVRLMVFTALTIVSSVSYGQYPTGQKMLVGAVNLGMINSSNSAPSPLIESKSTAFTLHMGISRFKTPTLVTGFGINYTYTHNRNSIGLSSEVKTNAHSLGFSYEHVKLHPLGNKFQLAFGGIINAGYGVNKSTSITSTPYSKNHLISAGVSGTIGVWHQLTPRFILMGNFNNFLNLSYSHSWGTAYNVSTTFKSSSNSFSIGTGLTSMTLNSFSFGMRYILK